MLNIDAKLLSQVIETLMIVASGLEHGHLTVTLGDGVLGKEAPAIQKLLLDRCQEALGAVELAALCAILDGIKPEESKSVAPTPDNVIIFPVETPEA